uniref:hypothetical protein n=1 Tax=Acetatifactor sp. TaxID=1872090 RepID=UPI004056E279
MDYYQNTNLQKPNKLSIAAMTLGILSVIPCCMGAFSIHLGALGILFAVLTRRKGQRMNSLSFIGMWLSCMGLFYGIFLLVQAFIQLPQILNDPASMALTNAMYRQMFGMDFEAFLKTYYGIQFN